MNEEFLQTDGLRRQAANNLALQNASQVDPVWINVMPASSAVGLTDYTLLHAGPSFKNPRRPSAPVLSSAVMACLYEGWAETEQHAEMMICSGKVRLKSAQDYGVVTPLAAVISPSTTLVEVVDRYTETTAWSMLSSGAGAQIRFGSRDPALLERLAFRDKVLAPALKEQLKKHPVPLIPLAVAGLMGGDDLHYETSNATQALHRYFKDRDAATTITQCIDTAPLFFLTLWMASCRLILNAMSMGASAKHSSLVVALAGNGESVGVCLSRSASTWRCVPAPAPKGPRLNQETGSQATLAAGAIGDSGVIDAAGFGAQLWHHIPAISETMDAWYQPSDEGVLQSMTGRLGSVEPQPVYTGLDITRIQQQHDCPLLAIAMLDREGQKGLLGKGVATLPLALFETALG